MSDLRDSPPRGRPSLAVVVLLGVAGGIFETTANNYYADRFHIEADERGDLELPREFPGFMVAVMSGALFFVAEAGLGAIAAGLIAAGLYGLVMFANYEPQYGNMIFFLVVWSTGTHLLMPVNRSIGLALAGGRNEGETLGWFGRMRSLATVIGCGAVWLYFRRRDAVFEVTFLLGAAAALGAACMYYALSRTMQPAHRGDRRRFVFRRRYRLYYVLSVLFGARKQLFITFGPWVLIKVYNSGPHTFAKCWMAATFASMILLPYIGRLIDRLGERVVLMADAMVLLLVCLTYGFAGDVLPHTYAFYAVCGAYVLDQFLFGMQMARTTYLSKIAVERRDIGSTLSLSVTIDHAVSIPIAMLGGRVWVAFGSHRPVFLAAAGVAVVTLVACSFIRWIDSSAIRSNTSKSMPWSLAAPFIISSTASFSGIQS